MCFGNDPWEVSCLLVEGLNTGVSISGFDNNDLVSLAVAGGLES